MFKNKSQARQNMKIIIVGCGKLGRTLVQCLSDEGHDVTVIDKKADRLVTLTNLYDVMGIEGNGASHEVQVEAGVEDADLFIAVTGSDELNLLCCTIATQSGNCAAIARVRAPEYSAEVGYLREKLGLAMIINPELITAQEMARILYLPSSLEVQSFAHGQAELVKFRIPEKSPLNGMLIKDLGRKLGSNILIGAVERNGEVYIPSGLFCLQSGDIPCLVSTPHQAREFLKSIGQQTRQVRNTMIIGGGRASYYLADQLLKAGVAVKIIENNRARCEELSSLLKGAIILNGDGADMDTLREEGICDAESFVPLTGIDEENIVLTLQAKAVSNAKVITKINRIDFPEVVNKLDLGSVIYPKALAAESIVAFVRAKKNSLDCNIETLYHLYDQRVEAIEFLVSEKSEVTDIPFIDLKLKPHLLVACIIRNGQAIFPKGQDSIQVGDRVIIVTTNKGFRDILDILA